MAQQPLDTDDAEEVKSWLASLKMEKYYDTFIKNGYDQLEAVAEITADDLKEMGVALGHIKIICGCCINAPFANNEVLLQSAKWGTFVANRGKKKELKNKAKMVEIQQTEKRDKNCIFFFEPVDNKTFRLKHKNSSCWLRVKGKAKEEVDGRSDFHPGCQLVLEKVKDQKGQYWIKSESNNNYISCTKPGMGKDELVGVSKAGSQEAFRISNVKKIGGKF